MKGCEVNLKHPKNAGDVAGEDERLLVNCGRDEHILPELRIAHRVGSRSNKRRRKAG